MVCACSWLRGSPLLQGKPRRSLLLWLLTRFAAVRCSLDGRHETRRRVRESMRGKIRGTDQSRLMQVCLSTVFSVRSYCRIHFQCFCRRLGTIQTFLQILYVFQSPEEQRGLEAQVLQDGHPTELGRHCAFQ